MHDSGLVLGLHISLVDRTQYNANAWGPHDTAAALVDADGNVLAAIEEERLNRIKHSNFFPVEAIRFCLRQAGVSLNDVDQIALCNSRRNMEQITTQLFLQNPEIPFSTPENFLDRHFREHFTEPIAHKLRFTEHHEAHAWSAYGCSDFDSALVVVLDGEGETGSGLVAVADGTQLRTLRRYTLPQSLGRLYQFMTHLFGFHRFDEYKVMGLAPYGDAQRYASVFERGYKLLPNGDYSIAPWPQWLAILHESELIAEARRKGAPFTQAHKDVSAALQRTLEIIVLHVLEHYRRATGQTSLCLAGGVAHNCSMNGRVYASKLFDRFFVQPASHDAGLALGSALHVLNKAARRPIKKRMSHVYLGTEVGSSDAIEAALGDWDCLLTVRKVDDAPGYAARLVADGAVIAWVQGRSEFGPRALGNRSIVADPRPAGNKDRINQMVKKREGFRPFAPSVLAERASEFFVLTDDDYSLPFMTLTVMVKEPFRSVLGAITHVDGSARIQTVSREANARYWSLLEQFGRLTGVPIVLNTSLNNHAEPIVDSIEDAIVCFLTTALDYLVVGDYVVEKRPNGPSYAAAYGSLYPSLPLHRFLTKRRDRDGGVVCELASNAHPWMSQRKRSISPELFEVLLRANGRRCLSDLLESRGERDSLPDESLIQELLSLWDDRAIVLSSRPAAVSEQHRS